MKTSTFDLIIWDVDGTLYPSTEELANQYRRAHKILFKTRFPNRSVENSIREFHTIRAQTKSSTQALSQMGFGNLTQVEKALELYLDRKRCILPNTKLIDFFSNLTKNYPTRHWAVRNGLTESTYEILSMIGFKLQIGKPFEKIIGTFDTYNVAKPSELIFQDIVRKSSTSADKILSVGDRIDIELTPAKKLGMHTAFITYGAHFERHSDVDFVVESPLHIASIL